MVQVTLGAVDRVGVEIPPIAGGFVARVSEIPAGSRTVRRVGSGHGESDGSSCEFTTWSLAGETNISTSARPVAG